MKIAFCAGFGAIVKDMEESLRFYRDVLGLDLPEDLNHSATDSLEGAKTFGLWPLSGAAQSCFGNAEWPADVPAPQSGIEFELESPVAVAEAAEELRTAGCRVLTGPKDEPWGQTVARALSPEGSLVSVVYTPWFHEEGASPS